MSIKQSVNYNIREIIYAFVTVIFLIKLNGLNTVLRAVQNNYNAFELLAYESHRPVLYFVYALVLGACGIKLIMRNVNRIRYTELEFEEIILSILIIIVIGLLIFLIIYFINNPILKVIISAVCIVLVFGCFAAQG